MVRVASSAGEPLPRVEARGVGMRTDTGEAALQEKGNILNRLRGGNKPEVAQLAQQEVGMKPPKSILEMSNDEIRRWPANQPRPWPVTDAEVRATYGYSPSMKALAEQMRGDMGRYPSPEEFQNYKEVSALDADTGRRMLAEMKARPLSDSDLRAMRMSSEKFMLAQQIEQAARLRNPNPNVGLEAMQSVVRLENLNPRQTVMFRLAIDAYMKENGGTFPPNVTMEHLITRQIMLEPRVRMPTEADAVQERINEALRRANARPASNPMPSSMPKGMAPSVVEGVPVRAPSSPLELGAEATAERTNMVAGKWKTIGETGLSRNPHWGEVRNESALELRSSGVKPGESGTLEAARVEMQQLMAKARAMGYRPDKGESTGGYLDRIAKEMASPMSDKQLVDRSSTMWNSLGSQITERGSLHPVPSASEFLSKKILPGMESTPAGREFLQVQRVMQRIHENTGVAPAQGEDVRAYAERAIRVQLQKTPTLHADMLMAAPKKTP